MTEFINGVEYLYTINCRSAKFEHSEVCHECMRNYWLKEMEEEICEKPQK